MYRKFAIYCLDSKRSTYERYEYPYIRDLLIVIYFHTLQWLAMYRAARPRAAL